jgi:hypothetical protein
MTMNFKKLLPILAIFALFSTIGCVRQYRIASQGGEAFLAVKNTTWEYAIKFHKGPFAGLQIGPGEITHPRAVPLGVFELEYEEIHIDHRGRGTTRVNLYIERGRTRPIQIFKQ